MTGFAVIIGRELRLALRQGSDAAAVLGFFVVTLTLFAVGSGVAPLVLEQIAGSVVWTAALLAAMLSLDRLFQFDYEDGGLELLVLAPVPLEFVVLAKCFAHWLVTGLPITVIAPVLGLLLDIQVSTFPDLLAGMALGTPIISLLGALGAALVLGARRVGVLVSLLILPLTIPVLIFGVAAAEATASGYDPAVPLMLLTALLLAALALCPWATAAALRQAVS